MREYMYAFKGVKSECGECDHVCMCHDDALLLFKYTTIKFLFCITLNL